MPALKHVKLDVDSSPAQSFELRFRAGPCVALASVAATLAPRRRTSSAGRSVDPFVVRRQRQAPNCGRPSCLGHSSLGAAGRTAGWNGDTRRPRHGRSCQRRLGAFGNAPNCRRRAADAVRDAAAPPSLLRAATPGHPRRQERRRHCHAVAIVVSSSIPARSAARAARRTTARRLRRLAKWLFYGMAGHQQVNCLRMTGRPSLSRLRSSQPACYNRLFFQSRM